MNYCLHSSQSADRPIRWNDYSNTYYDAVRWVASRTVTERLEQLDAHYLARFLSFVADHIHLCVTVSAMSKAQTTANSVPAKESDNPPPSKRRRVSATSNAAADPLKARNDKLWFSDGNVILTAEGSSFKLHCGILERHSPVFKELLGAKRVDEESVGGCRVVHIQEDGCMLSEILCVIYDGGNRCALQLRRVFACRDPVSSGFYDRRKPIDFAKLRTLILLAKKYQIRAIYDEALGRLEVIYPVMFDDQRVQRYSFQRKDSPISGLTVASALDAVKLARELDEKNPPNFIVMALYFCASLDLTLPLEGWRHGPNGDLIQLSRQDMLSCIFAREKLQKLNMLIRNILVDCSGPTPPCLFPACQSVRQNAFINWATQGILSEPLPLAFVDWSTSSGLCGTCRSSRAEVYNQRRLDAFKQLGDIFAIESWPYRAPKK